MGYLFHITDELQWEAALDSGVYRPANFGTEGFIHLSTKEELAASLALHFAEAQEVVILVMSARIVDEWVKWEPVPGRDAPMPHLHHSLPLEWVEDICMLNREADGSWDWEEFIW